MIKNIIKNINNFVSLNFIGYSVKNSVFLLIFLTILPATFLGTYLNFKWREQAQKQDLEHTEKTSILISQSYHQFLKSTEEMLVLLKKTVLASLQGKSSLSQLLTDFIKFNRRFKQVMILDDKGRIRFSNSRNISHKIPSLEPWIHQAAQLQEMVITDMCLLEGEPVIFFIVPLDIKGHPWAMVASMPLSILHSLANKAILPKTCSLSITDRQGKVLGHNALESRFHITKFYPDKSILEKIWKKNYGAFEQESSFGSRVLYNFLPVHTSKGAWSLIITYSKESISESTNRLFQENFTIFWITLFLGLLMAWMISYSFIARPLKHLLLMVKSLERGHSRLPYSFKGEFGTVASAFKDLACRLANRRESLEKSYSWFSDILELAGEAIVSFDKEGIIHFGNKTAHHIFGMEKEQLKGKHIARFIHKDSYNLYEEMLETLKRSPELPVVIEDSLLGCSSSQGVFPISATLSCLNMEERTLYVAIIRDITLRKKQEELQSRYNSELERSNSDLEEFAYTASHDLQEPLRMISMYLELLEVRYKEKLDKDAQEFIGFAVDGAHRMQAMIKDLLSYARAGRFSKSGQLVDPAEIVQDVLRDLRLSIEESKAQINISSLPAVWADKVEMKQIFLNIIGNSLKFRKDLIPKIQIWGDQQGDWATFHVQDNGIGFDPRFSDRIFGLFQRLHHRESYEGTGIGLALVKKIIQRRGGTIGVTSAPGKGTTFTFSLPAQAPQTGGMDRRSVA